MSQVSKGANPIVAGWRWDSLTQAERDHVDAMVAAERASGHGLWPSMSPAIHKGGYETFMAREKMAAALLKLRERDGGVREAALAVVNDWMGGEPMERDLADLRDALGMEAAR